MRAKPVSDLDKITNISYISVGLREEIQLEQQIAINGRSITKVVIDPHYKKKHVSSVTREIILALVMQLDGKYFPPVDSKEPFRYFVTEEEVKYKKYRLVWLLERNQIYIGIINAHRR